MHCKFTSSFPAVPAVLKLLTLITAFACFGSAFSQPVLTYTPYVQNLNSPVEIRNAGDGSGRLFVTEQGGRVKIIKNGVVQPKPFLDINYVTGLSNYQGLWSIAFSPNYKKSRVFFVLYTDKSQRTELVRYQASAQNPDSADLSAKAVLFSIDGLTTGGPHFGQMHFGADGYLYLTLSDGSSPDSTTRFAQNGLNLYGKMLRLNVNVKRAPFYAIPPDNPFVNDPSVADEIWALGFRNAWRWSFDYRGGALWLPDVEGEQSEELNVINPVQSGAGRNFGWPCYEGNLTYLTDSCKPSSSYRFPDFTYLHDIPAGGETIIGGYVYRGAAYPALRNYYVCSDFASSNAWKIRLTPSGNLKAVLQPNIPPLIESYGLDEAGEMYAAALNGIVYRVGAAATAVSASSEINNSAYINENKIYPTVARNYIILQMKDDFKYLVITDMNGKEVLHQKLRGKGTLQVDLPSLSPGMYIVQLSGAAQFRQKIYVSK